MALLHQQSKMPLVHVHWLEPADCMACLQCFLDKLMSTQELDKILACKIYGYRSVGELYDDSNGTIWISRIRTPCLLISADDDPFLDPGYALLAPKG